MAEARQRARRRALALLATAGALAAAACNALNGGHDRFLDPGDGSSVPSHPDAGDAADASATDVDAQVEASAGDAEAGIVEIPVSRQFTTLNGATFDTSDAGTTITAYDGGATHPVIVPLPQPSIPSEDFTVLATVLAPTNSEFGIVIRIQPDQRAVVFGSKFGAQNQPFLGTFGPPDWNPSDDARGVAYAYTPNARFTFKVRATANQITAKMWDASTPEPADKDAAAIFASPFTTGRGIGFYTYLADGGAVLESMSVTVP
jgi:hypothetical protein